MINIAIIVGSTRPGHKAAAVARWVNCHAAARDDATFRIVDLAEFDLPHLDEPEPAATGRYCRDHTPDWAARVAGFDGFVFVTPEYNHSTSGVLKNAIDFLYAEWNNKAAGFVGYGVNGGTRAVEHLRMIMAELQIADVRAQVSLSVFTDFVDGEVRPAAHQHMALSTMLDQVVAWAAALRPLRSSGSGADPADDRTAIGRLIADLERGFNDNDAERLAAPLTTNATVITSAGEWTGSRAAYQATADTELAGASAEHFARYDLAQLEFIGPDVALAHQRTRAVDAAGRPLDVGHSMLSTLVLVRTTDGWAIRSRQDTVVPDNDR